MVKEANQKLKELKKTAKKSSKKPNDNRIPENISFNCVELVDGEPTKIGGKPFDKWGSSQTRDICTKLGARGCRSHPTKKGIIASLKLACRKKLQWMSTKTRRQSHVVEESQNTVHFDC